MAKKPHGNSGNQNAAKDASEKVSGTGRLIIDLGEELRARLDASCEGGKLKPKVIEFITEALTKRGY